MPLAAMVCLASLPSSGSPATTRRARTYVRLLACAHFSLVIHLFECTYTVFTDVALTLVIDSTMAAVTRRISSTSSTRSPTLSVLLAAA
jgi:hypothetical protein